MKRTQILAVVLASSVFMGCALGSSSSTSASTKSIVNGDAADDTADDDDNSSDKGKTTTAAAATPTIEEAVVYDADGIKITAKEYVSDSIWGDGIKFLVENETDKNIAVTTNALIVNNYMLSDGFYADVAAGMKTNETMDLSTSQLRQAGIDIIGQIEIYFHIYDTDSYDSIADPDCILLKTSLFDQMDTKADDEGTVLYDADGIKIVGKYVDDDDFWGAAVLLYIENNSDRNVGIQTENFSVNGFTINSYFSATVYAGKKSYDDITLLSSELEENDITSVEEIKLNFTIFDPDTYDTITKSDDIVFQAK